MVEFVFKIVKFVFKMTDFAFEMTDFGAGATRAWWTLTSWVLSYSLTNDEF